MTYKQKTTHEFIYDSCKDITKPYSDMMGLPVIECEKYHIVMNKRLGIKPTIVKDTLVENYTIINHHPLVYNGIFNNKVTG